MMAQKKDWQKKKRKKGYPTPYPKQLSPVTVFPTRDCASRSPARTCDFRELQRLVLLGGRRRVLTYTKFVSLDKLWNFCVQKIFIRVHFVFRLTEFWLSQTWILKFELLMFCCMMKWLNSHHNLINHDFKNFWEEESPHFEFVWGRTISYKF
jgi:hypothetical protein